MNAEDFEKVYADVAEAAIRTVRKAMYLPRDKAEEAVQDAAIYVLSNLDRFEAITASYFKQLCVSRAKDHQKKEGRQHERALPIGDAVTDITRQERITEARRIGRKLAHPSMSKQEGDPDDDEAE